jgi:hypothetical protein
VSLATSWGEEVGWRNLKRTGIFEEVGWRKQCSDWHQWPCQYLQLQESTVNCENVIVTAGRLCQLQVPPLNCRIFELNCIFEVSTSGGEAGAASPLLENSHVTSHQICNCRNWSTGHGKADGARFREEDESLPIPPAGIYSTIVNCGTPTTTVRPGI